MASEPINPRLYDVSFERGFLPLDEDPLCTLPDELSELEILGINLPNILMENRIREACLNLNTPSAELLNSLSKRQAELALMRYDFIKSGFIHGQDKAPTTLPRNLGWPSYTLGEMLDKKTHILNYYSYTASNWRRLDSNGTADVDNLETLQSFLGTQDEAWFILIHVAIDYKEAELIGYVLQALETTETNNYPELEACLAEIGSTYNKMTAIFNRMGEKAYAETYHATRKWIHPFQNILYEGVFDKPVSYRGETGAQRPGMPMIDAALGIEHKDIVHLNAMRDYMPTRHVKFIDLVKEKSDIRNTVLRKKSMCSDAYNYAVEAVAGFRNAHYNYADDFINKQTSNPIGTGLTHFMIWLKDLRDETLAHRV